MAQWNVFDGPAISLYDPKRVRTRRRPRPAKPPGSSQRPDVQGLRALAVILVIADHLAGQPKGGFVGVDVFFAISGFLITGVLINAARMSRSIPAYFIGFYKARARRILPAAVVVLLVSLVAGRLIFKGARVSETVSDFWWSLGFSANFHFADIGTDYFQKSRPPSLMQHFWSLSVEEQFYLLWPIVIIVVFVLVRRRRIALMILLPLILALTALSFIWAVHATATEPTNAYFSPWVRAWELGVGAALAVLLARFPKWPGRLGTSRGPIALVAVAGVLCSAVFIRSGPGFPAPDAAAPVLLTALAIFAGTGVSASSRWLLPLTNRVSTYVGDISYSLYLWHWPVLIIGAALVSKVDYPGVYYPFVLLLTVGLSVFSHRAIEHPFRSRGARYPKPTPIIRPVVAAGAMVTVALTVYTLRPVSTPPSDAAAAQTPPPSTVAATAGGPAEPDGVLSRKIIDALGAATFPSFNPGLNTLSLGRAETDWAPCDNNATVRRSCIYPTPSANIPPAKRVVVLGDSVALAWMPTLRAALEPRGWKIYGLARQQCTAAYVHEKDFTGGLLDHRCDDLHDFYATAIKQIDPSLVIMSSTENTISELVPTTAGPAATYRAGLLKTDRLLDAPGRQIVTVSPPPIGKALTTCDTAGTSPADCVSQISSQWIQQSEIESSVAEQTKSTYLDTSSWFCSSSSYCPAFVGHVPVTYDGTHLTSAYARSLGPELVRALHLE